MIRFFRASPAEYIAATKLAPRAHMLTPVTPESLRFARCYIGYHGDHPLQVGYYLLPDGELAGLCNASIYRGAGALAFRDAESRGARHLSCYGGYLDGYYKGLGWVETGRYPFDPALAPPSWRSDFGTPDYVTLERKTE